MSNRNFNGCSRLLYLCVTCSHPSYKAFTGLPHQASTASGFNEDDAGAVNIPVYPEKSVGVDPAVAATNQRAPRLLRVPTSRTAQPEAKTQHDDGDDEVADDDLDRPAACDHNQTVAKRDQRGQHHQTGQHLELSGGD